MQEKMWFFLAIPLGLHYLWLAPKIGCGSTMPKQKNCFLFGIVFTLHYLCKLELCLKGFILLQV